jgi:hypothetical protein
MSKILVAVLDSQHYVSLILVTVSIHWKSLAHNVAVGDLINMHILSTNLCHINLRLGTKWMSLQDADNHVTVSCTSDS